MVKCNVCGDEFDTERGMKIHRTEVHSSEENSNNPSNPQNSTQERRINLNPKFTHLIVVVLFVGFIAGGFTGYIASDAMNTLQDSIGQERALAIDNKDNTNPSPSDSQDTQDTQDSGGQTGLTPSQISLKGEPVLGQEDAPVTLIAYEDFQCPFCQQFDQNAFEKIVENYVNKGKVKIVWKDRPLPNLHPWAKDAAATMECVYRKGGNDAFWAVKDKVFANQDSISTSNVHSKIKQWAAQEGVSKSAVQTCLDNGNPMDEVMEDSRNGQKVGASGTPTSFINGTKIVGAQPFSRFKTVIDQALNA